MILFVLPLTLFQKFLAVIHLECLCQQLEVVRCTQDALDSLIFSKQRSRLLQLAATIAEVRKNAAQWQIIADQVTVCGFSAGAHLASLRPKFPLNCTFSPMEITV